MNTVLITLTSDLENTGFLKLRQSLDKFGWSYTIIHSEWRGFCTKIVETYNVLKENPEVDNFFFCDASDVVVLGTMEEALSKIKDKHNMFFSAERGCFPLHYLSKYYPEQKGRYNYLNSGLYFAPRDKFMQMVEFAMPNHADEDQSYMNIQYLLGKFNIELDFNCDVFQSYSFIDQGDFMYGQMNGRLINMITKTQPVFVHGNGRTDMTKIYELL